MDFKDFPIPKRHFEYLAFAVYEISTNEGPAYFYFAIDAYSSHAFHLGTERSYDPETVLKYIFLLTENHEIMQNNEMEFTLVLDEYEEHSKRIEAILKGVGGKLMIHKDFNNYIITPVLQSLGQFLENGLKK